MMCGIGGRLSSGVGTSAADVGEAMVEQMAHRGPDAHDVYVDGDAMLSHRRLSIIDLSDAGRQPMPNEDGSVRIVFNGEIYNYRELRRRVDDYSFRSETDTEVLLHLYEEYGVDCLDYLRGMYAFAIYDERKDRLFLARDRLGQKPLYYHHTDEGFWFASTIAAILTDDAVDTAPDYEALRSYLTYQYVPHPKTGFEDIRRLGPAEYALVEDGELTIDSYWDLSYRDQFEAGPSTLADRLCSKLRESTRLRMRSDVPVGVFLSGGIDSTIVTALMADIADEPVNTYSIGFDEYDELEFANAVAEEYGTNHHEYTVTPDAMDVLPELVRHYEMPFGDPSAVPTYYVSQAAAEDVTVAVGGDAGDENFAGYDRYTFDRATELAARIPRPARSLGKQVLAQAASVAPREETLRRGKRLLANADGDAVERYATYICHTLGDDATALWDGPEPDDELKHLRAAFDRADGPTRMDRLMDVDMQTYLPEDVLLKVDRASMAHSLEVRSPFLDHEFVEFAARIPAKYKWRRGTKKWLLKRAFREQIPERVWGRSKQGFSVPVDEWFRGELREDARDALERLGTREIFDTTALRRLHDEHASGERDRGFVLWDLFVLDEWFRQFFSE
ncbi:asparagine synthase (glutamine-hydrolyzing) [Halovenus sp. WSH3]|uniref:Putative asparagine synthetase [glutamine-hydrolyzing] n=1 Tax=Halovenus carboxidivorans TaxID=2692199 RepID=A0A6B0TD89_9EURY|nr:asparagine synthase (glutamine-hydrolyzing) [Halovenus carboxidivorans]MXR51169.1 asparagine synthase (glutamine-hydrolyzing) [Halovenus carboxidivorans]